MASTSTDARIKDVGPLPQAFDIERATTSNADYRSVAWSGRYLQVTLMSIPVGGDIGLEAHPETDQFLRLEAGKGRVRILIDSQRQLGPHLLTMTFRVARSAEPGIADITFGNDPTPSSVSDGSGERLAANYEAGSVTITGPAAAGFTVSGRVVSPDGRGVRNAMVSITDAGGATRTVVTSSLGYYSFDSVAAGEGYVLAVSSRQYRFASRTIRVTGDLADIDLVGLE